MRLLKNPDLLFNHPDLLLTVVGFHGLVVYLVIAAILLVLWPQLWLTLVTLFFGIF